MDISTYYVAIRDAVQCRHKSYYDKFEAEIGQNLAEQMLVEARVLSKLLLVAKVFESAGVTTSHGEVGVTCQTGEYPCSVELKFHSSSRGVYLLNSPSSGGSVIVTDALGKVPADSLSRNLLSLSGGRNVYREFKDVLDLSFDWMAFCEFLLDAIHKVIYDRDEVVRLHFMRHIAGNNGDCGCKKDKDSSPSTSTAISQSSTDSAPPRT